MRSATARRCATADMKTVSGLPRKRSYTTSLYLVPAVLKRRAKYEINTETFLVFNSPTAGCSQWKNKMSALRSNPSRDHEAVIKRWRITLHPVLHNSFNCIAEILHAIWLRERTMISYRIGMFNRFFLR